MILRSLSVVFLVLAECVSAAAEHHFAVAYYPYQKKLRVQLEADAPAARIELRNIVATDPILAADVALQSVPLPRKLPPNARLRQAIVETPDLAAGTYEISLTLPDGAKLRQTFERKVWEWEHNDIGMARIIVPPFTPLAVDEDAMDGMSRVRCVLRSHTISPQALWHQVSAAGQEILAAPITLESQPQALTPAYVRVVENSPDRVEIEALLESDALSATVRSTFDYDGMMKVQLDLPATGRQIESLTLNIPLKSSVARLMHVVGDSIRDNPAGEIPAGDGVVWQSKGAITGGGYASAYNWICGTFLPYVWIGDELRGVCWFADSDRDWALDDERSALEIARAGDAVTLRVHLINKPTTLDRPRRIVFGLQATPVKPMPAPIDGITWRGWSFNTKYTETLGVSILGQCQVWGADEPYTAVYPRGRDFSIFEEFGRIRRNPQVSAHMGWVDASGWLDGYADQTRRNEFRSDVISGLGSLKSDRLIVYTNARGSEDSNCEEALNYNPRPLAGNVWNEPVKSFQDFALFNFKKMMELGEIDGIYHDNTYLTSDFDTIAGDAYVRDDGKLQPSMGLWSMRQYIKRIAVMYAQAGRYPLQVVHMTNANLIPALSFATISLDWEQHYGAKDFQTRFPLDYIRAQSIGRQAGHVPLGLGGIQNASDAAEFRRVTRTQFGVAMIHEIKLWGWYDSDELHRLYPPIYRFGYGKTDCNVFPYWEPNQPVTISGRNAKALVMARDGRAMIVLCSFDEGGAVTVRPDTSALAVRTDFSARDAESGEALSVADRQINIDLPRHDVRLIIIE